MVKLRALISYRDLQLGRPVSRGEIIEVSEKRAEELLKHEKQIVARIFQPTEKPLKAPKKPVAKKKGTIRDRKK